MPTDAINPFRARQSSVSLLASQDNGAHQEGGHRYTFFGSSGPFNGFKRCIHDGGHRAPLLVRWPGHVPANKVTSQQFVFYDFFPTAAALAGIDPDLNPPHMDGQSVTAVLAGGAVNQPSFVYHDFWHCIDAAIPEGVAHSFCQNVRMGQWSGVCVGDRSEPRVLPSHTTHAPPHPLQRAVRRTAARCILALQHHRRHRTAQ